MSWLAGAAVYLVSEAVAAAGFHGYSYADNYISDLGVSAVMNVGAFAVHGTLFLVGALLAVRGCASPGRLGRLFVVAAAANAVGNGLLAVFPSGTGLHVVGAAAAILGGNIAVLIGGLGSSRRGYRRLSVALGVTGIASLIALVCGAAPVGAVERASVYPIIGWELITAVVLLSGRSR